MVFKSIHELSPTYLSELFCFNDVGSSRSVSLHIPARHTLNVRAFQTAGVELWNSLPSTLREIRDYHQFKKQLKTHLFRLSFA